MKEGTLLLHQAAELNNYLLIKFLIMCGINLSAPNVEQETALEIIKTNDNGAAAKLLEKVREQIKFLLRLIYAQIMLNTY